MNERVILNHNAPIKKSLRSYKLFQWGNLVMGRRQTPLLNSAKYKGRSTLVP